MRLKLPTFSASTSFEAQVDHFFHSHPEELLTNCLLFKRFWASELSNRVAYKKTCTVSFHPFILSLAPFKRACMHGTMSMTSKPAGRMYHRAQKNADGWGGEGGGGRGWGWGTVFMDCLPWADPHPRPPNATRLFFLQVTFRTLACAVRCFFASGFLISSTQS